MNPRNHIKQRLLAALLLTATVGLLAMRAAPTPQTAKVEIRRRCPLLSIPGNPSEGRDPFFPASTRLFANNPKKTQTARRWPTDVEIHIGNSSQCFRHHQQPYICHRRRRRRDHQIRATAEHFLR